MCNVFSNITFFFSFIKQKSCNKCKVLILKHAKHLILSRNKLANAIQQALYNKYSLK